MFGHQGFSESRTGASNGLVFRIAMSVKKGFSFSSSLVTKVLRNLSIDRTKRHIGEL